MRILLLMAVAAGVWSQEPKDPPVQGPETVVLNDAAVGIVTFRHRMHEERAEGRCQICHHASRPEKPSERPFQACRECHTRPAQAGMKTSRQAAFHNVSAQSGTCADCHTRQAAAGKKPPRKCFDCHQRQEKAGPSGRSGAPAARLAG